MSSGTRGCATGLVVTELVVTELVVTGLVESVNALAGRRKRKDPENCRVATVPGTNGRIAVGLVSDSWVPARLAD